MIRAHAVQGKNIRNAAANESGYRFSVIGYQKKRNISLFIIRIFAYPIVS
jgi:hypothetical protein